MQIALNLPELPQIEKVKMHPPVMLGLHLLCIYPKNHSFSMADLRI